MLDALTAASTPRGVTRRHFLATGAAAAFGMRATAMAVHAVMVPYSRATGRSSPQAWLPDPPPVDQLRALARVAVDAARSSGADFADVRIGIQRHVRFYGTSSAMYAWRNVGYGVRAWRGDTWSFQHGNVLTTDAVAATARSAAEGARRYAAVNAQLAARHGGHGGDVGGAVTASWAAAPQVTGAWRVPVQIDPFDVPIDDCQRVLDSLKDFTLPKSVWRNAFSVGYVLEWRAETRVFASSEGSLVTQDTMCGGLNIQSTATLLAPHPTEVFLHQTDFSQVCAGFETVLRPEVRAHIQQLYDTAVRWEELPIRPFQDVGRFPVVFDGQTAARIIGNTLDCALDGDRVTGVEADASGGSFLMPPLDILAASEPLFSPHLTARVSRALPSPLAVQWDDDGVAPEPYTVVDRGRVVDFHTTRETAPALVSWYQRLGRPVRSHGGALALAPTSVPSGSGGHLTVAPAVGTMPLDDLSRAIDHGFLVINGAAGASPSLTAGLVNPQIDGLMLEIRRGVPVARTAVKMQFATKTILGKNLTALGDAGTAGTATIEMEKGIPWQLVTQMVTAPAMLCQDVEIRPYA
jgi:TldD protein